MTHNTLSAKGATFMRLHEGFRANWYLDPVGIPTIGIGFTWRSKAFRKWWTDNKPGVKFQRGASMTREEAEACLRYLCEQEYGKAVNTFLGKKVEQHVFDGMTSPVFNLGPGSLKWRWAQAVKAGNLNDAAAKLRVTGTTAQGRKLPGLVRRRKEEAILLSKGIYIGVDAGHGHEPLDAMSDGVLERGEAGPAVAKLIRDLHTLGFYDGSMDDIFGHGTEAAVLELQEDQSIDRDGKVGPETFGVIRALIASGYAYNSPDKPDDNNLVHYDQSRDTPEDEKSPDLVVPAIALAAGGVAAFWEKIETFFSSIF